MNVVVEWNDAAHTDQEVYYLRTRFSKGAMNRGINLKAKLKKKKKKGRTTKERNYPRTNLRFQQQEYRRRRSFSNVTRKKKTRMRNVSPRIFQFCFSNLPAVFFKEGTISNRQIMIFEYCLVVVRRIMPKRAWNSSDKKCLTFARQFRSVLTVKKKIR